MRRLLTIMLAFLFLGVFIVTQVDAGMPRGGPAANEEMTQSGSAKKTQQKKTTKKSTNKSDSREERN